MTLVIPRARLTLGLAGFSLGYKMNVVVQILKAPGEVFFFVF